MNYYYYISLDLFGIPSVRNLSLLLRPLNLSPCRAFNNAPRNAELFDTKSFGRAVWNGCPTSCVPVIYGPNIFFPLRKQFNFHFYEKSFHIKINDETYNIETEIFCAFHRNSVQPERRQWQRHREGICMSGINENKWKAFALEWTRVLLRTQTSAQIHIVAAIW